MIRDLMEQSAQYAKISLSTNQLEAFQKYGDLLLEWNKKINLTAIVEPSEVVIKHFIDSLLLLDYLPKNEGIRLIDVGTGAGFPGIPCKILREDIRLTLLDSLNKRIKFLDEVTSSLNISSSNVHGRAEELGVKVEFREQFDVATARAVAHLRELAEYCLPLVKVSGYFIALKGFEIEDEIGEATHAITQLGGKIEEVYKYELEDNSKRAMVIIKKISQTPTKFPRMYGKMKKQPL